MTAAANETDWPAQIFEKFKQLDIRQVGYVPDAGHTQLIKACHADKDIKSVSLTGEQEGIGLCAGAWLGGQRSALLMQSSGVGNCINLLGLAQECRFPLLMIVTMRGEWGEFNGWQLPMGQSTGRAFENAGVVVQHVDEKSRIAETIYAAGMMTFSTGRPIAVLIGQRVVGFKDWSK